MSAIWTYAGGSRPSGASPLASGTRGSESMTSGSVVQPISWLDVQKGEAVINGTISTVWDSHPQQCLAVSHTVTPTLPAGISIVDVKEIGGIIVSGNTTSTLITNIKNNYTDLYGNKGVTQSNTLPENTILTHYTPLSTRFNDYLIVITVVWAHDLNRTDSDTSNWIFRLWNNWKQEEQDVKNIVIREIK